MKKRLNFVSNSSSSSFIVMNEQNQLSKKEVSILKKYGFTYTYAIAPSMFDGEKSKRIKGWYPNLGYCVTCNQDDVKYFLIKDNISFISSEHYNHELCIYDNKSDKLVILHNFGEMYNGHIESITEDYLKNTPVGVISTGKEYLSWYQRLYKV